MPTYAQQGSPFALSVESQVQHIGRSAGPEFGPGSHSFDKSASGCGSVSGSRGIGELGNTADCLFAIDGFDSRMPRHFQKIGKFSQIATYPYLGGACAYARERVPPFFPLFSGT